MLLYSIGIHLVLHRVLRTNADAIKVRFFWNPSLSCKAVIEPVLHTIKRVFLFFPYSLQVLQVTVFYGMYNVLLCGCLPLLTWVSFAIGRLMNEPTSVQPPLLISTTPAMLMSRADGHVIVQKTTSIVSLTIKKFLFLWWLSSDYSEVSRIVRW